MWFMCLFLIGIILSIVSCQDEGSSHSPVKLHPFDKFNSVNFWEFQEKVNVTRFYVTPNPIQCARLITSHCCKPLGFLYDQASRACVPIAWRDGIEIVLQDMGPGNSSLYSFRTSHCRDGYTTYVEKVNNYSITTCVGENLSSGVYPVAESGCDRIGGFMASAKTQAKLDLLIQLSREMFSRSAFWIGLDHFGKPLPFRWISDGTELTQQQVDELFEGGAPREFSFYACGAYVEPGNKISNIRCDNNLQSFCEIKPGCNLN